MSAPVDRSEVRKSLHLLAFVDFTHRPNLATLFAAARAFASQRPASDEEIARATFNLRYDKVVRSRTYDIVEAWRLCERRLGIAAPEPAKAKEE